MKKVIRIQKKDHTQETLDGEQLQMKIIRKKNRVDIDVYPTTLEDKGKTV